MPETDDSQLLRDFTERQSDAAFGALVTRHVNLVHSVALRQTGDPHAAEEITQAVFIILARKAGSLGPKTILSGWLYQTARLTAANFLRGQIRRQQREQEAHMQSLANEAEPDVWPQIAPLLDDALGQLGERDRHAIVLRFFENKRLGEVGAALGATEDAAKMRVNRALEKLRKVFTKRGVTLTATLIAGAVATNSVQAAPAGLAVTVMATAAKGTLISATVTTLVTGTMKTMTWLKLKFAAGMGVAALLAGGVVTVALSGKATDSSAAVIPTGGHTGVTIFSLLEKIPNVANAIFEREMFAKKIPAAARKQTFSFRRDGDNYLLGVDGGAGHQIGRFGGIVWLTHMGHLTEYDPKINNNGGGDGGLVAMESAQKRMLNLFLTLGITDMQPGTAIWDENRQRFTGRMEDGTKITVDTKLENGVPSVATILRSDGQAFASVRYKYAPTFYEGQVPVEFTRYWGNFTEDDKKVFTVRVQSLEISDEHLDTALIDPSKVFPRDKRVFYSNNVPYWIESNGKASRVLTMDEYKQQMEMIKAKEAKR
jgi:RNA polymerase sigma factor (sigma-70 family)